MEIESIERQVATACFRKRSDMVLDNSNVKL